MISNYSAFTNRNGKDEHFVGEENGVKFKIVCPNCKAEGENLEHKNWYLSKECGEDLIIVCKCCGYEISTETEEESKCKVIINEIKDKSGCSTCGETEFFTEDCKECEETEQAIKKDIGDMVK